MIITREKGMRMWGGGSGNTSVSGASSGGGFSLTVAEGEGTGNAYTDFTYESGTLTLNKATEFVTVDFFNKLFTAYDANGNVIAPNNTTPTLDNIKFRAGAWTEQYLSALGQNSSGGGGGGGGIELSDVWQSLKTNTDDYANQKINAAHIPDLSGTYATKTWVNQQGFVTSSGVTSVAMTVPTGLSVSGTPITSTGTLALTFASGYSIPTTAKQSNWDTAYGWGNHATAGYASASSVTTLQGYFTNGVAKTAAKLNTGTTTYTAWGQTYWSSGVPQSISGNMTSVGSITPSANGNNLGTSSARFNIYGTGGNFSSNVSIGGTLGVTGAATLSSTLSVAGGITLTTTKKIYFGDTSHYLELNSTGFHFSHGVYSDGFVSALGSNSSGGGGGGIDLDAMWTELKGNTGTYANAKINVNHIPDISSTYGYAKTSQLGSYLPLSGGTMSNTNLVTNLNADLLDGHHASYFAAMHTQDNYDLNEIGTSGGIYRHGDAPTNAFPSAAYGNTLVVGAGSSSDTCFQLGAPYGSSNLYFRTGTWYSNGTGTIRTNSWMQVAFTDSNVASATKLHTPRTIWGQNFDGTGNVSGALTDTHGLRPSESVTYDIGSNSLAYRYVYATWVGSPTNNILQFGANSQYHITVTTGGNVGIGTTSPSYKLDVDGDVRADNFRGSLIGNAATATKATQDNDGNAFQSYYLRKVTVPNNTANDFNTFENMTLTGRGVPTTGASLSHAPWTGSGPDGGYGVLTYLWSSYGIQMAWGYNNNHIYIRNKYYSSGAVWSDSWSTIALTSDNVASATKLQTARTIWGQNFDGTGNVSGALTDTHGLRPSESVTYDIGSNSLAYRYVYATWVGSPTNNILQFGANNQSHITVTTGGNVGIGTTSPSSKLHVAGNILASGEVTASSDERKKNIISNTKFNVKDIASARSIIYEWNDDRDKDNEKKIHGGSIAQDWLGKADSFLSQDNDGWYSINYGALALCSAITIARMTINHEDRITLLEKENAKLKARVAELEERRA